VKRADDPDLIVGQWPQANDNKIDDTAEKEMELLQKIVTGIRTVRSRMNVPPGSQSELIAKCDSDMVVFLQKHHTIISALTQTSSVTAGPDQAKPEQKRADEINGHLMEISKKLSNEKFISRAPQSVVAREKEKQEEMSAELEKVNANLEMLQ